MHVASASKSDPTPLAWIIAVISAFFTVILAIAVFLACDQVIQHLSYLKLSDEFTQYDEPSTRRYFDNINGSFSRRMVSALMPLKSQATLAPPHLETIFLTLTDLAQKNLERATIRFQELASSLPENSELQPTFLELEKKFSEAGQNRKRLALSKKSVDEHRNHLKVLYQQHVLVSEDAAALFGLDSIYEESDEEEVLVYEEGVLKGFPLLENLPDGVADLPTLKVEIEKVGGAVKLSAANAFEVFQQELKKIRTASEEIVNGYLAAESSLEQAELEFKNIAETDEMLLIGISKTLRVILLQALSS